MLNYKVKSVPMKKTLAFIILRFYGFTVLRFCCFLFFICLHGNAIELIFHRKKISN
jgi:hypothetical protein